MKKIFFMVLTAAVIAGLSLPVFAMASAPKQDVFTDPDAAKTAKGRQIIVYYFHGAFRCYTCTNMENYAKEAIETNFKDDLAAGLLEFKEVNVEDRGNEHFADDYKLYTKTLILSYLEDGKEVKFKNLDKIWEYARDKNKFMGYVALEVRNFMKENG